MFPFRMIKDIRVTLLDYTGFGHPAPSHFAAAHLAFVKETRMGLNLKRRVELIHMEEGELMKHVDAARMSVRSSWEFIDYSFLIEGVTRAFTHQMVRTRTASYAQEAMRIVDVSKTMKVTLPNSVRHQPNEVRAKWYNAIDTIQEAYSDLIKEGVPVQDARGLLPTNIQTRIIVKMNLRTLADLAAKRINARVQDEYSDVVKLLTGLAIEVHPWTKLFLFPERAQTPAIDALIAKALDGRPPIERPEVNDALKELDQLKAVWG